MGACASLAGRSDASSKRSEIRRLRKKSQQRKGIGETVQSHGGSRRESARSDMGSNYTCDDVENEGDAATVTEEELQPFREAAELNRSRRERHEQRYKEYRRVSNSATFLDTAASPLLRDDGFPSFAAEDRTSRSLSEVPSCASYAARSLSQSQSMEVAESDPSLAVSGSILVNPKDDDEKPQSGRFRERSESPSVKFVVSPRVSECASPKLTADPSEDSRDHPSCLSPVVGGNVDDPLELKGRRGSLEQFSCDSGNGNNSSGTIEPMMPMVTILSNGPPHGHSQSINGQTMSLSRDSELTQSLEQSQQHRQVFSLEYSRVDNGPSKPNSDMVSIETDPTEPTKTHESAQTDQVDRKPTSSSGAAEDESIGRDAELLPIDNYEADGNIVRGKLSKRRKTGRFSGFDLCTDE